MSQPQTKTEGAPANKNQRAPKAKGPSFSLKTPKGTRDYEGWEMAIRTKVFDTIQNVFRRHGAQQIDTPVFELKETLTGKYGEEAKLIFDLADQGGEICSMRYDLTVPFARFCAAKKIQQIKRYQIGKVYRRDQPIMTRGRYREFYQCDFDIAGSYDAMAPDAEALKVITEILDELNIGEYEIKLNDRRLLDGIFELAGVREDQFRPVCSAVDKMDKLPWADVRDEMVNAKGLSPESADKIGEYVRQSGAPQELWLKLSTDAQLMANPSAKSAMDELKLLFDYLDAYGCVGRVCFDLSLARGLDYYTGVIFEAILKGANVGSITGGGRYDKLIGMYGKKDVPAIGFSVGVERLFTIMEEQVKQGQHQARATQTAVLVCAVDKNQLPERMRIVAELWKAGIAAEVIPRLNPKIQAQLTYANEHGIPYAIVIGQNEVTKGTVQLKDLLAADGSPDKQVEIPRSSMVEEIQRRLTKSK